MFRSVQTPLRVACVTTRVSRQGNGGICEQKLAGWIEGLQAAAADTCIERAVGAERQAGGVVPIDYAHWEFRLLGQRVARQRRGGRRRSYGSRRGLLQYEVARQQNEKSRYPKMPSAYVSHYFSSISLRCFGEMVDQQQSAHSCRRQHSSKQNEFFTGPVVTDHFPKGANHRGRADKNCENRAVGSASVGVHHGDGGSADRQGHND